MLINKKTLQYLAELARIKIEAKKEEKLLKDLEEILTYFEELKALDTSAVLLTRLPSPTAQAIGGPVTGGTNLNNVFREDEPIQSADKKNSVNQSSNQCKSALINAFPEEENGFLKVPAVFE